MQEKPDSFNTFYLPSPQSDYKYGNMVVLDNRHSEIKKSTRYWLQIS